MTSDENDLGVAVRPVRQADTASARWIVFGVIVASILWAGNPMAAANPGGWTLVRRFFASAITPELDAAFLELIARESMVTMAYAVVGTAVAVGAGLLGAVLLSRRFWSLPASPDVSSPWYLFRALAVGPRAIHEVVWALLFLNALGLDPMVAVLAIGLPFGAITAKVYADAIDDSEPAAFLALRAAGAGRLASVLYGIVPQIRSELVSYAFYRFECAIRSAAILGIVGAGGVGFQLKLSFTSLHYDEVWTAIYAIVLLEWLAETCSTRVTRPLGLDATPPSSHRVEATVLLLSGAIAASWWWLDLHPSTLVSARSRRELSYLAGELWPPSLPDGWVTVAEQSVDTIVIAVLAIASAGFAAALIVLVGLAATRSSRPAGTVLHILVRSGLLLARAIPPPVWAIVVLLGARPGPWPGAVALACYNVGVLGRLFAGAIDGADLRVTTALKHAGASQLSSFAYGLAPEVAGRFRSISLYRWEVAVRDTVVVGVVGAGGLGRAIDESLSSFAWAEVLGLVLALATITIAVDTLSGRLRRI